MARRWLFLVVAVVGAFSALLVSCGPSPAAATPFPGTTPFPTLPPTPTPVQLPDFISFVGPPPGEWALLTPESGFGALLYRAAFAEAGEPLSVEDIRQATEVLADGQRVVAEIDWLEADRVLVRGIIPPRTGEHEATIRVRSRSGELLEFSWRFTLVAEEPGMPGLPEVLQFVRPVPDSTISLLQYREEQLVPSWYFPAFVDAQAGICVGMLTQNLVERFAPTDVRRLWTQDTLRKVSFVALDGVPPSPEAEIVGGMEADVYFLYDEEGNLVGQYGGPHQYKCWRVELAPGPHSVTVRVEQPAGQVTEFSWWFVIVED